MSEINFNASVTGDAKIMDLYGVQFEGIYLVPSSTSKYTTIAFVTENECEEGTYYVTKIEQGKGNLSHEQFSCSVIPREWIYINTHIDNFSFLDEFGEKVKNALKPALLNKQRIFVLPGIELGKTHLVKTLIVNGYEAIELNMLLESMLNDRIVDLSKMPNENDFYISLDGLKEDED